MAARLHAIPALHLIHQRHADAAGQLAHTAAAGRVQQLGGAGRKVAHRHPRRFVPVRLRVSRFLARHGALARAHKHRQHALLRLRPENNLIGHGIDEGKVAVIAHRRVKVLRRIQNAAVAVHAPFIHLQRHAQQAVVQRGAYLTHPAAHAIALGADVGRAQVAVRLRVRAAHLVEGKALAALKRHAVDAAAGKLDIVLPRREMIVVIGGEGVHHVALHGVLERRKGRIVKQYIVQRHVCARHRERRLPVILPAHGKHVARMHHAALILIGADSEIRHRHGIAGLPVKPRHLVQIGIERAEAAQPLRARIADGAIEVHQTPVVTVFEHQQLVLLLHAPDTAGALACLLTQTELEPRVALIHEGFAKARRMAAHEHQRQQAAGSKLHRIDLQHFP